MGERVGGPPLNEAENYFKCHKCGGWSDARDLGFVEDMKVRCHTRRKIACNNYRMNPL
jgi:hypothetical protein